MITHIPLWSIICTITQVLNARFLRVLSGGRGWRFGGAGHFQRKGVYLNLAWGHADSPASSESIPLPPNCLMNIHITLETSSSPSEGNSEGSGRLTPVYYIPLWSTIDTIKQSLYATSSEFRSEGVGDVSEWGSGCILTSHEDTLIHPLTPKVSHLSQLPHEYSYWILSAWHVCFDSQ